MMTGKRIAALSAGVVFSAALLAAAEAKITMLPDIPVLTKQPVIEQKGAKPGATRTDLAHMPLRFEPNQGQAPGDAQYISRGPGYSMSLTPDGATIALSRKIQAEPVKGSRTGRILTDEEANRKDRVETAVLQMRLEDANPAPRMVGQEPLPGRSHYYNGKNAAKWTRDVAHFGRVAYQGVYPGINLVYYGNQETLEYDFVVGPGADPSTIRMHFAGADKVEMDANGNLRLTMGGSAITQRAPVVYQERDGDRVPVQGRYLLADNGGVGFSVAEYDRSRPLIIDPVMTYATYIGGSGDEYSSWGGFGNLAVDPAGNMYVFSSTGSLDLPVTPGVTQSTLGGMEDVFVARVNAAGTLDYVTYLGGSDFDWQGDIAVDANGYAVISGQTLSADFPVSAGAWQGTHGGMGDGFLARLSPTGQLVFSTLIGGSEWDSLLWVELSGGGDIYGVGYTQSVNLAGIPAPGGFVFHFDAAGNAIYFTAPAVEYIWMDPVIDDAGQVYLRAEDANWSPVMLRLNAAGGVDYTVPVGGWNTFVTDFKVDGAGRVYMVGDTGDPLPVTADAHQPAFGGGWFDGFLMRLGVTGAVEYATYLGGSGSDYLGALEFLNGGGVAVGGSADSIDLAFTADAQWDSGYGTRAIVGKFSATGALDYLSPFGWFEQNWVSGLREDGSGGLVIAVDSYLYDPYTWQVYNEASVRHIAADNSMRYETSLGSTGWGVTMDLETDSVGAAYLAGIASEAGLAVSADAHQPAYGGGWTDLWVAKVNAAGDVEYASYLGGSGEEHPLGPSVWQDGNLYLVARSESPDVPTTADAAQQNFGGGWTDALLARFKFDTAVPGNHNPVADAGGAFETVCTGTAGVPVTLDGTASTDPDGDTLTYVWSGVFAEGDTVTGANPTVTVPYSQGVTLTVSDGKGGMDRTTVPVSIRDFEPPVLTIGQAPVLTADATGTAQFDVRSIITVTDNCHPNPWISILPEGPYPVGTTNVHVVVNDSENFVEGFVDITVAEPFDITPPVLTVPTGITLQAPVTDISPAVLGMATATDDTDPNPVITWSDSSVAGTGKVLEIITRTWTATDASGNVATGTQRIYVTDQMPPMIKASGNIYVPVFQQNIEPGVGVPMATAEDAVDPNPVLTWSDVETEPIDPITTKIARVVTRTWVATDMYGNSSTFVQQIKFYDEWGPTINIQDQVVEAPADTSPAAIGTPIVHDDGDTNPTVTYTDSVAAGTGQVLQVITRTWTATDKCGNTSTAVQTITVRDTIAPVLSGMPADLSLTAADAGGAVVTYTMPTASDAVDPNPVVSCGVASGALMSIGSHTVTCTATDASGNASSASFTVTVDYVFGGFQVPIKAGGTYQSGQTLPVRFQLFYANNALATGASPTVSLLMVNTDAGTADPIAVDFNGLPDPGNVMSYDPVLNTYMFNLGTPQVASGTYRIQVDLGNGLPIRVVDIRLK